MSYPDPFTKLAFIGDVEKSNIEYDPSHRLASECHRQQQASRCNSDPTHSWPGILKEHPGTAQRGSLLLDGTISEFPTLRKISLRPPTATTDKLDACSTHPTLSQFPAIPFPLHHLRQVRLDLNDLTSFFDVR